MFKPIKELGQNFLLNRQIVRKMVDAMELKPDDTVVEVGPGLGILTQEMAERIEAKDLTVYAVEIDTRFVENLKNYFALDLKFNIIEGNILKWLPEYKPEKPFKILGSLPYYITSPIIHSIIKMEKRPDLCVLLIQKEVAEKVAAKAPDSSYMSSIVQTFYDVSYMGKVDRKEFSPSPEVDGGIIKLMAKQGVQISNDRLEKYIGFLHRGFSNPRKMLNKIFNKEELAKTGIDGNLRAQNLNAEEWVKAFQTLVT
jgi:16S rRNA (adenine1518-N6/adenine1519-N6)-dimethyltransferase